MSVKQLKKADLVAALVEETSLDKRNVTTMLDSLSAVITREVAAGNTVLLPGLAKFICRDRPARTVRNPATGAMIEKEADRGVRVTPAKALKDAVK